MIKQATTATVNHQHTISQTENCCTNTTSTQEKHASEWRAWQGVKCTGACLHGDRAGASIYTILIYPTPQVHKSMSAGASIVNILLYEHHKYTRACECATSDDRAPALWPRNAVTTKTTTYTRACHQGDRAGGASLRRVMAERRQLSNRRAIRGRKQEVVHTPHKALEHERV